MSLDSAYAAAADLDKAFYLGATKAAASSRGAGGSPYAAESASRGNPFGQSQNLANASKQYAALRDVPYTAIRPIAVKVADQPIRVGFTASRTPKGQSNPAGMRTKSLIYLSAPTFIQKQIAEGMEPDLSHPLLEAFESPNDDMTGWALLYCTAFSIYATGDAYWMIDRTIAERLQFYYLPKTWITPIHTKQRAFAAYKMQAPGVADTDAQIIPFQDMLHFRFPDPADPLGSMSPLQSQARAVNTDDEIQKAQFASMKNGIHPSVLLRAGKLPGPPGAESQGIVPVLTPEQRKQLIDTIRMHAAGAMHFGDPMIIDGMIEGVEQFSRSPAELAFPDGSRLTKDRIMQGIGTSPVVAGQSENANRAGSATAHDIHYGLNVNPVLSLMGQTMTSRLSVTDQVPGRKLYVWFEIATAKDAELDLAKMTGAQAAQAVTKNEWREFCGLPKSTEADADSLPKPLPPAGAPAGTGPTRPKPPPKKSAKKYPAKLRQ